MKLRLFALRDLATGRILPNTFFASKPEAKRARDQAAGNGDRLCVTYGPDHRSFKG